MKDSKCTGASLSHEKRLSRKFKDLNLKEKRRRKQLQARSIRKRRIFNAPHNTNTFIINSYLSNQCINGKKKEEEDDDVILTGSMIGYVNCFDEIATLISNLDDKAKFLC